MIFGQDLPATSCYYLSPGNFSIQQLDACLQVNLMDETVAPAEVKTDPSAHTANNTPSKPRQSGHAAAKKQPKAAKQLRFEGHAGAIAYAPLP